MGFTKLDEKIIFSSIMGEDDSVFRVWVILLATCKENGVSPTTEVFLAKITDKPIEEISRCIGILSAQDKNSRSTNDEGRRVEKVDGGFRIINYHKYRESSATDFHREKMRKYREKTQCSTTVVLPSASASVSASVSDKQEENQSIVVLSPLDQAMADFAEMRSRIRKPMTDRARVLTLKKLEEIAPNDTAKQVKILEQSVANSWQGVFPLGGERGQTRRINMNRGASVEEIVAQAQRVKLT